MENSIPERKMGLRCLYVLATAVQVASSPPSGAAGAQLLLDEADSRLAVPVRAVSAGDGDGEGVMQSVLPSYSARGSGVSIAAAITGLFDGEDIVRLGVGALAERLSERREGRRHLEEAFREAGHQQPDDETAQLSSGEAESARTRRASEPDAMTVGSEPASAAPVGMTSHESWSELSALSVAEAAVMAFADPEGESARARSLRQERALRARAARIDLSEQPGLTRGGAVVVPEVPELPIRAREEARKPSPDQAARRAEAARTILLEMAAFLESHETVEFTTRYTVLEQGTNGMVTDELDTEFAYAVPDRFVFTTPGNAVRDPGSVRSDGLFVIRSAGELLLAEPAAPSLTATLRSPLVADEQAWSLGASRILMLTTTRTVHELLQEASIDYVGTASIVDTPVHHLRITTGGVQPNGKGFGWDLFVTSDDRPRPLAIVPDFHGLFPQLADRARYSESSIVFSDWRFNRPGCEESFVHQVGERNTLAGSREELNGFDLRPFNPMVGRTLPDFTAIDRNGDRVVSRDLYTDGPAVITFWNADYLTLFYMQPVLSELREIYAQAGVRFVSIHPGNDQSVAEINEYVRSHGIRGQVLTGMTNVESFQDGVARIFFYSFTPTYYELGEVLQTFIVGTDGRIHGVHDLLPSRPYRDVRNQIDGLLAGRDIASDTVRAVERESVRRAQFLTELRARYGHN